MKKINNRKTKFLLSISAFIFATAIVSGVIFTTQNASADSNLDYNAVALKILLNEMQDCFVESEMHSTVSVGDAGDGGGYNQYTNFVDSVLKNDDQGFEKDSSGKKLLPTQTLSLDKKWKSVNCAGLFTGGDNDWRSGNNNFSGVFGVSGKSAPTSAASNETIGAFLTNIGFSDIKEETAESGDEGEVCYTLSYKISREGYVEGTWIDNDSNARIAKACWSKTLINSAVSTQQSTYLAENASVEEYNEGIISFVQLAPSSNGEFGVEFAIKYNDKADALYKCGDGTVGNGGSCSGYGALYSQKIIGMSRGSADLLESGSIGFDYNYANPVLYDKNDDSEEAFGQALLQLERTDVAKSSSSVKRKKYTIAPNTELHRGVYTTAYRKTREYLSGESGRQEITDDEKYVLYKHYLEDIYGVDVNEGDCYESKPSKYKDDSSGAVYMNLGTELGWCSVVFTGATNEKVAILKNQNYELDALVGPEEILGEMFELDLTKEDIEDINKNIKKKEYDAETEAAAAMDPCFSRANTVGWIICPVIELLSTTTEGLYTWIEDDFLSIEAKFFVRTDASSVYSVWNEFVGFANIVLVVFLLIIVFSQLTGVGIDNYGIKKTLPKIIIAAILINMSYIICELSVDLSNILGRALNDWFTAMGQGVPYENVNDIMGITDATVGTHAGLFRVLKIAISDGVIASGALTVVELAQSGGFVAILLPLLSALIIALVAIFFFFILLGLRKAGVIILVAISPLAFVCYMLPNTKPLFKKWVKALEGLLLLYPICGLMIGGGYYVSRVIFSISNDYFMRFTALMLQVIPFFFIPKLLTSSFAAMGNIGAKITSLGKGVGRKTSTGLDKAIKNTDRYKARQNDWDMRSNYRLSQAKTRRANDTINALTEKQKSGAKLNAAERMRLAQANQIRQGERDMQTKAYESQFSNYGKPEMQTALTEAFGGDDENAMMAAINTAENGKMDEQLLNALYQSNTRGFSEDILQRLSRSANGVVSAYAKEQLKRGASERKSFSDFVNNNTDVKSDTNSLHAYQQGKGSNWVTGMNDDTLKFINSKNQHAFEANALLNAASQTQNLKELNPLNDMIKAAGITDPSMITGKMLEGMDESTAQAISELANGREALQRAWADVVKDNRESNVSGAVRNIIGGGSTTGSGYTTDYGGE